MTVLTQNHERFTRGSKFILFSVFKDLHALQLARQASGALH